MPVASIRFARTNSFSEGFNVGAILNYIGKIGWINYIIALVLITLVIAIPICILVLGFILLGGITMVIFKRQFYRNSRVYPRDDSDNPDTGTSFCCIPGPLYDTGI